MKKLLTILFVLFLPFTTSSDLLPNPIDIDMPIEENESVVYNYEDLDLGDTINEEDPYINFGSMRNIILEEDDNTINEDIEGIEEIEEIEEVEKDGNGFEDGGMGMIAYGFCNEGLENITDSLNVAVTQQEPFTVCFLLENYADIDLSIQASLVSTVLDDQGGYACGLDTGFQSFITSGELGIINIPAKNYVIKEFDIMFPLGYDGEKKGCLVYNMYKGENEEEGIGLKVVMRRGLHMNYFVGAIDGIKNEFTINKLTTNLDDNGDLILSFWVENTGNMENRFNIQGTVKGFFGYNKIFEATDGQLAPGKSQFVEINLGSLPSYGGKYNIDFTINGTPYFSYDISNANVDPARLEPKSRTFGTTYFKMPWLILAVVVIFILLLIVLFKKPKQKVVYVQQAQQSQQPVQAQPVQQPTQQYTQPVQPSQPVQQPVQQPTQPVQQPVQQPQNQNYPQN